MVLRLFLVCVAMSDIVSAFHTPSILSTTFSHRRLHLSAVADISSESEVSHVCSLLTCHIVIVQGLASERLHSVLLSSSFFELFHSLMQR
jgi:hypothetical protein